MGWGALSPSGGPGRVTLPDWYSGHLFNLLTRCGMRKGHNVTLAARTVGQRSGHLNELHFG